MGAWVAVDPGYFHQVAGPGNDNALGWRSRGSLRRRGRATTTGNKPDDHDYNQQGYCVRSVLLRFDTGVLHAMRIDGLQSPECGSGGTQKVTAVGERNLGIYFDSSISFTLKRGLAHTIMPAPELGSLAIPSYQFSPQHLMIDDSSQGQKSLADDTDSDLITYTQVGCCAVGNYTSKAQRLSLRARLEREREERAQRRQASFVNTFRNLFGSFRH